MRLRHLLVLALLVPAAPAFGQGTLLVTNTNDSGAGSLRQAVQQANSMPGAQTIAFNIPTSDPNFAGSIFYITIENSPSLTLSGDGTVIDGATQTAFTGDTNPDGPEITLFGSPIQSTNRGFIVTGNDNVVKGIGGFQLFFYGIEITGNRNRVEGCAFIQSFAGAVTISGNENTIGGLAIGAGNDLASSGIGVEIAPPFGSPAVPTGNVIQGNLIAFNHSTGVLVTAPSTSNVIGGATAAARNLIHTNGHTSGQFDPVGSHVTLASSGNVLQGNWIGISASGGAAGGLALDAVGVQASNNAVIGNVIGGMNTFASEPRAGIHVSAGTGSTIRANLVGTDPTGSQPRPNTLGIVVSGGSASIGGSNAGDGNTIAFNQADGVSLSGVPAPVGTAILGNSIFENGDLGIDLELDGPTANDLGDADGGSNRRQNHPVIEVASFVSSSLTLTYRVDTAPANATYPLRVEFFRADASASEGRTYLGFDVYTAANHAMGAKTATFTLAAGVLTLGDSVVGTATDALDNTSEFGAARIVTGPEPLIALFCFGDGSGTSCPCGNASTSGSNDGCLNSLGLGARLRTSGVARIGADTLTLIGTQMPNSSALYFQGTNRSGGGAGVVFNDGLRCAGGTVIRLGTKLNATGASQYPASGDASISTRGSVVLAGTVRTYQTWYRNAALFCTAATSNQTNGVEVRWEL